MRSPPIIAEGGMRASRQSNARSSERVRKRRDAIDGQSCARTSTTRLRPSVLNKLNADGSTSSRRTICGELIACIACYGTDESSSSILRTHTSPVSACAMRQCLRPSKGVRETVFSHCTAWLGAPERPPGLCGLPLQRAGAWGVGVGA